MSGSPTYGDIRSDFWKRSFDEAVEYDRYLAASPSEKAARWTQLARQLPALTDDERRRVEGYPPLLKLLLVSGVWCGDCVRQGPMLKQIVDACRGSIELRVIDRDASPPLRDEVRILGAKRVPVAVALSLEFFEVGRFGDRMLTTYRRKALTELGPACPCPTASCRQTSWPPNGPSGSTSSERVLLMARLSPLAIDRLASPRSAE